MKYQTTKNRIISYLLIFISITSCFYGCGRKDENYFYLAERLSFGNFTNYAIPTAAGNTIYFACYDNEAVYSINMDSGFDMKKIGSTTGNIENNQDKWFVYNMSANSDGSLDQLLLYFGLDFIISDVAVKRIDQDGNELKSTSLFDVLEQKEDFGIEHFWASFFFLTDDDGFIYLILRETLYIWDADGNFLSRTAIGGWINGLSLGRNGQAYVMWNNQAHGYVIAGIDRETGSLGQGYELGWVDMYTDMTPGHSGDLLLATGKAIYDYDIATGTQSSMIVYANLGISSESYASIKFLSLEDKRIVLFIPDNDGVTTIWLVTPMRESEYTAARERLMAGLSEEEQLARGLIERETLTLGLFPNFFDQSIRQAVFDFNSSNPDYRIEINEYDDVSQWNMAIITGKTPDIIVLPRSFSMDAFARLGVFTDLYPLLDNDPTITRTDLKENILRAYERDGQLFAIPMSYMIRVVYAARSEVGDIYSWTLDEMIAYVDGLPDIPVFYNHSKSGVLDLCLRANGDIIIDWADDGAFNRDLFIKMLTFANRFTPDHLYNEDDYSELLRDKQIKILHSNFNEVTWGQLFQIYLGEPAAFPGFPTENGSGNLAESFNLMAISQKTTNKEAAWSFISSMLTEEFQSTIATMDFPIRNSVFEALIEEAKTATYYTDGNGVQREHKKTSIRSSIHDEEIDLYAATEEDIKLVRNLIANVTKARSFDEQIDDILKEEAQSFFSGAKTAEEAADIAANRIGIYVNEMK